MYRVRKRTLGTYSGGSIKGPTPSYDRSYLGGPSTSEVCKDHTSPGPPYLTSNSLGLRKATVTPTRANGWSTVYGVVPVKYNSVPIGLRSPDGLPLHTLAPWNSLETAALAELNPSAPIVDLGEFLFELREAKKLVTSVKSIWDRRLNSNPGSDYLAYNFGWRPLIADLLKMVNLAQLAEQRIESLQKRVEEGVRINLGSSDISWLWIDSFDDFPYLSTTFYSVNEHTKNWCTGRYSIIGEVPKVRGNLRDLVTFGLSQPATSTWNALPWSWLIDYFVNIGTFLEAASGGIPFTLTDACIMSLSQMDVKYIRNSSGWGRESPGSATSTEKRRQPIAILSPKYAIEPLLTSGQKLNLTALAIARSAK